jgi:hypothetical protein
MSVITGWVLPIWAIVGFFWGVIFCILAAVAHNDWAKQRESQWPNDKEKVADSRAAFLWALAMAALTPLWPFVTIGYGIKFIQATYREIKVALAEEVNEGFMERVQARAQEKRDQRDHH